jgi:hypothetical protein
LQGSCNAIIQEAPIITVVDARTRQDICDAKVTATPDDGRPALTLATFVPPADAGPPGCQYDPVQVAADGGVQGFGTFAVGTYTIAVSKPGYKTFIVDRVQSKLGGCGYPEGTTATRVPVSLEPL